MPHKLIDKTQRPSARRGAIALFLLVATPIFLIMLAIVLNIANQWHARVELENGLEAAALAAVKTWGDQNGQMGTLEAREVGVAYAARNFVRCERIGIGLNYDPINGGVNQNDECDLRASVNDPQQGNLIFGAITNMDPLTFNAGVAPNCAAAGNVLIDASSQNLAEDNAWGISFRATNNPATNMNLKIVRIEIDIDPNNTGNIMFDFTSAGPVLSDNSPQPKVQDDTGGNSQPDNVGWALAPGAPTNQISFLPTAGTPTVLVITFGPDSMVGPTEDGVSPGDRFRFGAGVRIRKGNGNNFGTASADDLGGVRVTLFFELNGVPTNGGMGVSANLINTNDRKNDCFDPGMMEVDAIGQPHLVVHPTGIQDLPCPPTAAAPQADNNGQAFVEISEGSGLPFAVRAQAKIRVPIVAGGGFGFNLDSYCITVKVTAMYDCKTRRPRLVRVERFICPGP